MQQVCSGYCQTRPQAASHTHQTRQLPSVPQTACRQLSSSRPLPFHFYAQVSRPVGGTRSRRCANLVLGSVLMAVAVAVAT